MGLCLRLRVSTDVEIGLNFLLAQHALVDLSSPHLLLGESSPEVGYQCWSAIAEVQSLCIRLIISMVTLRAAGCGWNKKQISKCERVCSYKNR